MFENAAFEVAAYGAAYNIACKGGFHCLRSCLREGVDGDAKVLLQFAHRRAHTQAKEDHRYGRAAWSLNVDP